MRRVREGEMFTRYYCIRSPDENKRCLQCIIHARSKKEIYLLCVVFTRRKEKMFTVQNARQMNGRIDAYIVQYYPHKMERRSDVYSVLYTTDEEN
jgi:hypothetical protein